MPDAGYQSDNSTAELWDTVLLSDISLMNL